MINGEKPFRVRLECQRQISVLNPKSGRYIKVGCGKCPVCRMKRSNQWFVRLRKQLDSSKSAYFVTLTYSDENIPHHANGTPTFCKSDLQKFNKRVRKHLSKLSGYSEIQGYKYFLVAEYGPTTLRPHYHAILFNLPTNDLEEARKFLEKRWDKGFVTVSFLNSKRIHYTAKYCTAITLLPKELMTKEFRPFTLCSKHLGVCYLTDDIIHYHQMELNTKVKIDGFDYAMPRYYRNKIFDEYTLEMLAEAAEAEADEYQWDYFTRFYDYDRGRFIQDPVNPNMLLNGKKGEVYAEFERHLQRKFKNNKNNHV